MELNNLARNMQMDPAWGKYPEPPAYYVGIGDNPQAEKHYYDENTIKNAPEEDKAAWKKWQEDKARWDGEMAERTMIMMYLDAIVVPEENYALDSRWAKRQSLKRAFVSEDPDERKIQYCDSVVISSPAEFTDVMDIVMSLTGVSRADLEAAQELFRAELEERAV